MRTRPIGSLDASVVGLGCNNFGRRLDQAATKDVVDAAIDVGATFFDTADVYGDGESETFLGRVLQGRRDRVVLATKFGAGRAGDGPGGAHPDHVRRALDASLRRLRTDRVDLYQLHRPDPDVPIDETVGALARLVRDGAVREIGVSNFDAAQLRAAAEAAGREGIRIASVQNEYSMLHREPEAEVLPACDELDVAFLPYFPLLSGILTGKYRKGRPLPEGTRVTGDERWEGRLTPATLDLIEELVAFAEARDRELLDLAFAWLLAKGSVASVIAGASSPDQVRRNARTADWVLAGEELGRVDALLEAAGQAP